MKKEGKKAPASPSTEMRQVIVFDTAADSRNTHFENRCLLLLRPLLCDGKPQSRSNLVTLRFTLVVMAK